MNTFRTLLLLLSFNLISAGEHESVATKAPEFPNIEVLNLDGETVKFYDSMVKGKVIAMNFIFSSCPSICPLMQVTFSQLQKDLEKANVTNIELISVSVDPNTDTPARLREWSQKFGTSKPWNYVTGEKRSIDRILKKLEVFTSDINDHPSFILIGDDVSGKWKRVNSLAPVETLTKELLALSRRPTAEYSTPQ